MGNLDYTQVLNKIENTRRFGNEPGVVVTAQVIKVLREKGKQKRIIPYIHVAGTNGKGSVCAFFSSILKKEHMRVGTFVSPHLVDFEERITVDGRMIPKEDVTRLGNYLLDIDFGIGLTMFDYCLAMACRIFGINFFWHTNLRLLRFPDWVAHDRFQSAHIAFSRIAQIDFVMVSCIRNIQFVSIRFHIVVH